MRFLVVTLAPTMLKEDGKYYSYAPYVKEMDLWFDAVDTVAIVSPTQYNDVLLLAPFKRTKIDVTSVPTIAFTSFGRAIQSVFAIPVILWKLAVEFRKADHIHLRCPGNMGLLGAFMQVFFPKKKKTAKYAGNWDPKAKQPFSYRLQKWILSNTLLTKNMQVLVYGAWKNQTKNIKSFFTATYPKSKIAESANTIFKPPYRFLFVGMLSAGKQPLYAIQLVENMQELGVVCSIDLYGDGAERASLETYIEERALNNTVTLHGNKSAEVVEAAYKSSHFLVLPSGSEGWPKVVAEAMFWGVVPIVSKVSCVPWMLDEGKRGLLLDMNSEEDAKALYELLQQKEKLDQLSLSAKNWSRKYTVDDFKREINALVR